MQIMIELHNKKTRLSPYCHEQTFLKKAAVHILRRRFYLVLLQWEMLLLSSVLAVFVVLVFGFTLFIFSRAFASRHSAFLLFAFVKFVMRLARF
mgnify:CR=1 FL=1